VIKKRNIVILDSIEYDNIPWVVESIRNIKMNVGDGYPIIDYLLRKDDRTLVLRDVGNDIRIALEQYYPDNQEFLPWCDESQEIIEAVDDPTGVFYRFRNEENEECYTRIGGIIPIECSVRHLNKVSQITMWDFFRKVDNFGVQEDEYLYVELSGIYNPKDKSVKSGDKTIRMLRGRVIPRIQVF
jgi:hypothetical protein